MFYSYTPGPGQGSSTGTLEHNLQRQCLQTSISPKSFPLQSLSERIYFTPQCESWPQFKQRVTYLVLYISYTIVFYSYSYWKF
jgi:hypothetical protein